MQRRPLLTCFFLLLFLWGYSQTIDIQTTRTYDGSSNNLLHTDWGAAGTNLLQATGIDYEDGISAPTGTDRPNPREISNDLFAQLGLINDPLNLSDFCWVWGQFIDHDIGITPDGNEPAIIPVPAGDYHFDPMGTGQAIIPMMRNVFDPTTGTDEMNPRQHPNMITAFIDGSGVYGSSEDHANYLRSFVDGKLKVSANNLLPFNTTTGEFEDPIDPDAPHMDNPVGLTDKVFVAGDVRANENPLLAAFHTIFVREHNRICDELIEDHPDWTDEQLYQHARKIVGGLIQAIVFEEWLPAMGVDLPPYDGYKDDVPPQLLNVFTAAAFRLGHTLLNSQLQRKDNNGETIPEGNLLLRDAFFNPLSIVEVGGIDPFIKGMGVQIQQSFDPKVVDDIRNFLFGPPGAGGLDLASININRGRERGLKDFNSVRAAFGLTPYQFFQQINSNAAVFTKLLSLYADINNIDLWVGLLSEQPMPGALFGETIMEIMKYQFLALRDGDRFYYENDPVLSDSEKAWIKNNNLHDVIMRNTDITLMQDDVFLAMPHSEICGNMTVAVNGNVITAEGDPINNVQMTLTVGGDNQEVTTQNDGAFGFTDVSSCNAELLIPSLDTDINNGVTTFDLILIQKHILGVQPLDTPYKMIAADVDNSETVSTLDMIHVRKVILGIADEFPNNTSWRFVLADYEFLDPQNPLLEDFPEVLNFNDILSDDVEEVFIGVKVGDINGNAVTSLSSGIVEERTEPSPFVIELADMEIKAGQQYEVSLNAGQYELLEGFQFGLQYETTTLRLLDITPGVPEGLSMDHFGSFDEEGMVTTSWNAPNSGNYLQKGASLFTLHFQALRDGRLSDLFNLNEHKTKGEAYDGNLSVRPVRFSFSGGMDNVEDPFELFQNVPNPFAGQTTIPFYIPGSDNVEFQLMDISGKVLYKENRLVEKGSGEWVVQARLLPASGIFYYQISSRYGTITKKMILVE